MLCKLRVWTFIPHILFQGPTPFNNFSSNAVWNSDYFFKLNYIITCLQSNEYVPQYRAALLITACTGSQNGSWAAVQHCLLLWPVKGGFPNTACRLCKRVSWHSGLTFGYRLSQLIQSDRSCCTESLQAFKFCSNSY